MLHRPYQGVPSTQNGLVHLTLVPQSRFLTGHGIEAIQDALDGMDRELISLDNINTIYIEAHEFKLYFLQEQWQLAFLPPTPEEVAQYIDTLNYMLREGMVRTYSGTSMSDYDIEQDQRLWKRNVFPTHQTR